LSFQMENPLYRIADKSASMNVDSTSQVKITFDST
jgi:hypothetical protein